MVSSRLSRFRFSSDIGVYATVLLLRLSISAATHKIVVVVVVVVVVDETKIQLNLSSFCRLGYFKKATAAVDGGSVTSCRITQCT